MATVDRNSTRLKALAIFADTPIAALEDYGLSYRLIELLEKHCGLYVKSLSGLTAKDLQRFRNLGPKQVSDVRTSLALLLVDIEKGLRT